MRERHACQGVRCDVLAAMPVEFETSCASAFGLVENRDAGFVCGGLGKFAGIREPKLQLIGGYRVFICCQAHRDWVKNIVFDRSARMVLGFGGNGVGGNVQQ